MKELRYFIRHFRPRRNWMVGGGLLMLLTLLAGLGLMALSGWFITAAALAAPAVAAVGAIAFDFFRPSAGIRFFAITRTLSRYAERLVTHEATFRLLADLRVWLFGRMIPLDAAQLGRLRGGDMLNRITADIDALDALYLRVVAPTVVALLAIAVGLLLLALVDPVIAAAAGLMLLAAGFGVPLTVARLGAASGRRMVGLTAGLRGMVVDGVQGIAEIKVFGAEARHRALVDAESQALIACQLRMSRITGGGAAAFGLIANLAIWSALFLGVGLVEAGTQSGPMVALAVLAVMALFEAVAPLPMAYQYVGKIRAAARRLLDIAEIVPSVQDPAEPVALPSGNDVAFSGVVVRYGDHERAALDDVSLAIADGERVAVVGRSGAGKSTLAHLVPRLWDPTGGAVEIGGVDIRDVTLDSLRARVAVLSQRNQLFNGTVRHNLLIGRPEADDTGLWRALRLAGLDGFVHGLPFGLDTWIGEAGARLSGGQARRLALARVLLKDAPILILDEPTEGLDVETERSVMSELAKVMRGRTTLLITHREAPLDFVDRVVTLDEGRIVEEARVPASPAACSGGPDRDAASIAAL